MRRRSRRDFVQGVALLALGCTAASALAECDKPAPPSSSSPSDGGPRAGGPLALTTLTPATFATLSALCERLLPRDEQPGALDLGVPDYIDRALAAPDLAPVRSLVERLLPVLERETRERFHGRGFHDAPPEEQDAMIEAWMRGHERTRPFFDAVLSLTLEGAFGDPKYGGNKGGEGYALIGFTPGPPLHKMAGMAGMEHGD